MLVKPYGDTLDDGAVQLSFTLPLENSSRTREAARQFALKLGFDAGFGKETFAEHVATFIVKRMVERRGK